MSEASLPGFDALPPADMLLVGQRCHRFEAAWKAWREGPRPVLEEHLAGVTGDAAVVLLGELLHLELIYRRRHGETPTLAEYVSRFRRHEALLRGVFARVNADSGGAADTTCSDRPGPAAPAADTLPAADSAPLPQVLGYALEGVLGKGGMGVVYRARHLDLKRTVALKMMLAADRAGEQERLRFKAEAEAMARLQHPHIVQVFEVGSHEGLPFCALEFVEGGSLEKKLRPPGGSQPLTPQEAAQLVATLADAMHLAHSRNVIHRDLKPANILLTADGTPKVTDFGLARQLDSDSDRTRDGAVMGTPAYMAPEQASGQTRDAGPAADVYALGAILYACLTGRPPFQGATVVETLDKVRQEEPVPPRQWQPAVPRDLETICLKCLRKQPEERYASARELGEDLRRFLDRRPVRARPVGSLERAAKWVRRNPVVAGLTGAVALVLVLGSVLSLGLANWALGAKAQAVAREKEARLRQAEALGEKERADASAKEARLHEAEALIEKARAVSISRRPGHRFEALATLKKAADIGRELEQPPDWFDRVRNETIAALALPDLHLTDTFGSLPAGTVDFDLSYDLELYARSTDKGATSVRRVADDVEIAHLPELGEPVWSHFGPRRLFGRGGTPSGLIQLWDLNLSTSTPRVQERQVSGGSLDPDGRRIVLGYKDGSLKVFATDTGSPLYRLAGQDIVRDLSPSLHPTEPIVAVLGFSLDGSKLLQLRDLKTGDVLWRLRLPRRGGICAWSPNGRTLAVSDGVLGEVQLFAFDPGLSSLRLNRTLRTPGDAGLDICFNAAGDRLASRRGWGGAVSLFDTETGRLLFSTQGGENLGGFHFDQSGQRLVGARREKIGVWSVADGREYRALVHDGPERGSHNCFWPAVHPAGRVAAVQLGVKPGQRTVVGTDGMALFDLETGRELAFFRVAEGGGMPWFDGAGNLYTNSPKGVFRWPVRPDPASPGRLLLGANEPLPFPARGDRPIVTSRDGRVIVQATWGAGAWGLHPSTRQARQLGTGRYNYVSVSPDGLWIACGPWDVGLDVFEAATGKCVWQSRENNSYCRFSADGRWLLAQDQEGGRAYAVPTWQPGPRLGPGVPCDVSADGRLAVLAQDGSYRLVEMATGRELARLEDPDQVATFAVFTPDGTRLVARAEDGLRVWDLRRIRSELVKLDLDWRIAPYRETAEEAPREIRVEQPKIEGLGTLTLLPRKISGEPKWPALEAWSGDSGTSNSEPQVAANVSDKPVVALGTSFPPCKVTVHPTPTQFVAVLWESPEDTQVLVEGRIAHATTGGNGIAWWLTHRRGNQEFCIDSGVYPSGGEAEVLPRERQVRKGDVIVLAVDARDGDDASDTTLVDLTITEKLGEQRRVWDLAQDVGRTIHDGNPHADRYGNEAVWQFARGDALLPGLLSFSSEDERK